MRFQAFQKSHIEFWNDKAIAWYFFVKDIGQTITVNDELYVDYLIYCIFFFGLLV